HTICTVTDAKKGQVYSAYFRYTGGELERIRDDEIVDVDSLCSAIEQSNEKIVIIGDLIYLNKSTFLDRIKGLVYFAPGHLCSPRASSCAVLGVQNIKKAKRDEVNTLVPRYIRGADA
nr:hypothetical protein [Candidatus Dadabacteria bacterium]